MTVKQKHAEWFNEEYGLTKIKAFAIARKSNEPSSPALGYPPRVSELGYEQGYKKALEDVKNIQSEEAYDAREYLGKIKVYIDTELKLLEGK